MADYCTQAEVEGYLNVDFTYNPDPTVAKWIAAASAKIDTHCQRDFARAYESIRQPGL